MIAPASRYALLGRLATGGMAELFLARPTAGAERGVVVLKRIKPRRLSDPKFVSMFLDEARLAAQLDHDNIARVHDIGRLGESYFFTMEYVHGEDVRTVLGRLAALGRPLPLGVALYIARAVAAGLHYAHERVDADGVPLGVVHRDVSPSNIMVGFDGRVKLVDFGVAKAAQRTVKTEAGAVKGKVTYFSPEQCRGRPVDRQSDVFSLGIVLHEMVTGRRLYKRETDYHTMMAILAEEVTPPSRGRADVTPGIDDVVRTALAKDPAQRYPTAGAMAEAIDAVIAHDHIDAAPAGLVRVMTDLFGARPVPWLELAARDDAASMVTVTSAFEPTAHLAEGTGAAGDADGDTAVETQLARMVSLRAEPAFDLGEPDTDVSSPSGDWFERDPDDEWRDEPIARGELRPDAPPVDPAAAIAEVQAAAVRASRAMPAVATPAVGDRRVSITLPAVRRRRIAMIVVVAVVVVAAVAAAVALAYSRW